MAANNATTDAQNTDSRALDSRTQTVERTRTVKTTQAELDEKMPDSIKKFGAALTASAGRTFACPECGEPSNGTCPECGFTHRAYRRNPQK